MADLTGSLTSSGVNRSLEEFSDFVISESHNFQQFPHLLLQQAINQRSFLKPQLAAQEQLKHKKEHPSYLNLIWRERPSGAPVWTIRTRDEPSYGEISATGHRLVLCDGEISIYDTQAKKDLMCLAEKDGIHLTAALSREGAFLVEAKEILAAGSRKTNVVSLWNIDDKSIIGSLACSECQIRSLQFSSDSRYVCLGGASEEGGEIILWDTQKNVSWRRKVPGAIIRKVVFCDADQLVIAAQGDGICSFWDTWNGECIIRMKCHDGAITGLAMSHSGALMASCGTDGACNVWKLTGRRGKTAVSSKKYLTENPIQTFRGHKHAVSALAFLDDTRLISGDTSGVCHVWDVASGSPTGVSISAAGTIKSLSPSSSDELCLILSRDDRVGRVHQIDRFLSDQNAHSAEYGFVCFSDEPLQVITVRESGEVEGLDLTSIPPSRRTLIAGNPGSMIIGSRNSLNGRYIVMARADQNWTMLDQRTGKQWNGKLENPLGPESLASVSNDGRFVAFFYQEKLEVVETSDQRRFIHELPIIGGALEFMNNEVLQIVGINSRLPDMPAGHVVWLQILFERPNYCRCIGPFGETPVRMPHFAIKDRESFYLSHPCGAKQWAVNSFDVSNCDTVQEALAFHESFPVPTELADYSSQEKTILVNEPTMSFGRIISQSQINDAEAFAYPFPAPLKSGTFSPCGKYLALLFANGSFDILEIVNPR